MPPFFYACKIMNMSVSKLNLQFKIIKLKYYME